MITQIKTDTCAFVRYFGFEQTFLRGAAKGEKVDKLKRTVIYKILKARSEITVEPASEHPL